MQKSIRNRSTRRRVAFSHIDGKRWTAGIYYLKNLFIALQSLPENERPEIVLIVSDKNDKESFGELIPHVNEIVEYSQQSEARGLSRVVRLLGQSNTFQFLRIDLFGRFLKDLEIDVFFTRGAPPLHCGVPVISWIPDFQHKHFPHFFSEQEIKSRDASNSNASVRASRIVLSSKAALADYQDNSGKHSSKGRVLSFVAQIDDAIHGPQNVDVCSKYYLPEKFILLPNQFWKHKNHETVVHAMRTAVKQDPDLTVVCTGNTNEYRDDKYFSMLLCELSISGLRERMVLLGLVPRTDLLALMRQSIAVLQPSLFEGWNTAIEEAKSLGKRLLVSDIPVHREQGDETVRYFPVTDSESLAQLLLNTFDTCSPGPDEILEERARALLKDRTVAYGRVFMDIVHDI